MDDLLSESNRVAEDAASYALYPRDSTASLEDLRLEILSFVTSFLTSQNYIWQKDSFHLTIGEDCLKGRTRFGDCIDDEWLLVWILKEISGKWSIAASIEDNDGQFLLIEAADALPKWVTPENAEGRVWIANGQLHLLPLTVLADASNANQAVQAVFDDKFDTVAPTAVQNLITTRISGLPNSIQTSHLHNTLACLPEELLILLEQHPAVIASIVDTFYHRDSIQLRSCQNMSHFSPTSNIRLATVRMTRPLYAQLMGQNFFPPKPFERARWFSNTEQESNEWRWRDIGLKIMCGAEMLYQETAASLRMTSLKTEPNPSRQTTAYTRFLQSLNNLGYFQGELQGSSKYTLLEEEAFRQFSSTTTPEGTSSFASLVEGVRGKPLQKPPQTVEDSDTWLDMNEGQLDALLESKRSKAAEIEEDEDEEMAAAEEHATRLDGLADKLEGFIHAEGDMDGALFEDEMSDDSDDSDDQPEMDTHTRQERLDKLVPGLESTEWGKATQSAKPQENCQPKSTAAFVEEKYDGVSDDSDDGLEPDDVQNNEDDPAVFEDQEVDMENEMHDFLRFTVEALGLSEDQYQDILKERSKAGAFVPPKQTKDAKSSSSKVDLEAALPSKPVPAQRNAKLDSFEALMDAMDAQLRPPGSRTQNNAGDPLRNLADVEEDTMDDDMDAELADLLKRDPEDLDHDASDQLRLVKNLLASFDSQQGAAGPASNLIGRLDPSAQLPRNADR